MDGNLASDVVLKVIVPYFVIASIILVSGYFFPWDSTVPILLSILLLIPLFVWYNRYFNKEKLSKQIEDEGKSSVLFWVLVIFFLAMFIRIISVMLFSQPYEKTPLIYLTFLAILFVDRADVSVFGFKKRKIGKALLYGLVFYLVFGGLALLLMCFFVYYFSGQNLIAMYDFTLFLLAMPFMTLCVGISEEGLFRGYMQTHFQKLYSPATAILIQAVFFGVWHFVWNLNPFDPFGMAMYVATTFFIGLIFGYFYSKARNLVPLILTHGLWNSVLSGVSESAEYEIVGAMPLINQIIVSFLPYMMSTVFAIFFIRYVVKEI